MRTVSLHSSRRGSRPTHRRGLTLLELMVTVAVIGLLFAIALPSYSAILKRQKIGKAAVDLVDIAILLERYRSHRFALPETLDDLDGNLPKDPWGRDYRYLNFSSPAPGNKGKIRKDHNLHPLNTEFDLYSLGKDGESRAPLTAKASRDDVIYARDGGFVGLAEDF